MVFLGYGIALIAFYYWIKCNWFVPLVMLVVLTVSLSGWGTFNWLGFFELAGFCYAPIIARAGWRLLLQGAANELNGRTWKQYFHASLNDLFFDPPYYRKQKAERAAREAAIMARRQPPPAAVLMLPNPAQDS